MSEFDRRSRKLVELLEHIEHNLEHVLREERHLLDRFERVIDKLRACEHGKTFPQVTRLGFSAP